MVRRSGTRNDFRFVNHLTGILKRGSDIVGRQPWVGVNNPGYGIATGHHAEDVRHPNAGAPNRRLSAADVWIDNDTIIHHALLAGPSTASNAILIHLGSQEGPQRHTGRRTAAGQESRTPRPNKRRPRVCAGTPYEPACAGLLSVQNEGDVEPASGIEPPTCGLRSDPEVISPPHSTPQKHTEEPDPPLG